MPLGDSITESSKRMPTYRYYLWKLARARGYRIDLVGSQRGAMGGTPLYSDFDMDHEGHSGWRADRILGKIAQWSAASRPAFVLIHLGHNDLCQGQSVSSTVEELGAIIDALREANSHVVILLAQVIASSAPCMSQIPVFNAQLLMLADKKMRPFSPVVIVDQHSRFDPHSMTRDGIHPNARGESLMADRWMASLAPYLDKFFAAPRAPNSH
ncbi:SGNH hydrolase [Nitrospira sp.]|nr:SGNH hydrolase [Nitrospira sp.]